MNELGALAGETTDSARAINNCGDIVGTSSKDRPNAFQYTDGVMISLNRWSTLRAELEASGVGTETAVLNKQFVQAGWMQKMMNSSEIERPWRIRETTSRLWEEMAAAMGEPIQNFAQRLFETYQDHPNVDEVVKKHTGVDLSRQMAQVKLHLNCNACSKDVEGHHLMPGHILAIDCGSVVEHWLCLSPACDLVPGQGQRWGREKSDQLMPFKAVLLEPLDNINTALKQANGNETVFIRIGTDIKAFKFSESQGSNPRWEQMFAASNGTISRAGELGNR